MEGVGGDYRATLKEAQRWGEGFASVAALLGKQFPRAEPWQRAMAYLRGKCSGGPSCQTKETSGR
jgi:hypothetical protein